MLKLGRAAGQESAVGNQRWLLLPFQNPRRVGTESSGFCLSWFQKKWLHQEKARFQLIGRRGRNVLEKGNRLRDATRRSKMVQRLERHATKGQDGTI